MAELKHVLIVLFLLAVTPAIFAETIQQTTFQELGQSNFTLDTPQSRDCFSMNFEKDLNLNSTDYYTVVSLHTIFNPINQDANISVFLNDEKQDAFTFKGTDMKNGWFRMDLPREQLKKQNQLSVCLKTTDQNEIISVFNDSTIGTYKMADFRGKDFFINYVPEPNAIIGDQLKVVLTVINHGSESADVLLQYRKFDVPYLPLVKGETFFKGSLQPGEEKTIEYLIKALEPVDISLPPAVLSYVNTFGENEVLESERPQIHVREPEFKVRGIFVIQQQSFKAGEQIPVDLVLKNEGIDEVREAEVQLQIPAALTVPSLNLGKAFNIQPGKVRTLSFTVSSATAGTFDLGCKISYADVKTKELSCEGSSITFQENSLALSTFTLPLILAIIAVAMFGYIYYSKEQKFVEPAPEKKRFQFTPKERPKTDAEKK